MATATPPASAAPSNQNSAVAPPNTPPGLATVLQPSTSALEIVATPRYVADMTLRSSFVATAALVSTVAGCSGDEAIDPRYAPPPGFVENERIVYTDGLHNENTEMLALDDRIILIFRGGETAQIGSDQAHINV
jgi:hypothetical protein